MKNTHCQLSSVFLLSTLWLFVQYNTTPILPVGLILLIIWVFFAQKSFKTLWRNNKKKTIGAVLLGTILGFLGTGLYLSTDYLYKYDLGAQVGARTLFESQYFPPTQYINVFTDTTSTDKVEVIKSYAQNIVDMFNEDAVSVTSEFIFIQGQQLTPETAQQILPAMAAETGKILSFEYVGYAPTILQEDKTKASTIDAVFKIQTEKENFKFMTLNLLQTDAGFKTTGLNFLGKNTEAKIRANDGVLPTPNDLVIISVNQELDTEAENNDTPEAN